MGNPSLLNSQLLSSNQQQQQTVIGNNLNNKIGHIYLITLISEPILKSQYLTKLQRILPSYLDGLQSADMERALDEVAEKIDV